MNFGVFAERGINDLQVVTDFGLAYADPSRKG